MARKTKKTVSSLAKYEQDFEDLKKALCDFGEAEKQITRLMTRLESLDPKLAKRWFGIGGKCSVWTTDALLFHAEQLRKLNPPSKSLDAHDDVAKCTICGKPCDDLRVIDDVDRVCPNCLDEYYERCDVCGEYWHVDYISVDEIDGQMVCEHCQEDL